MHALDHGAILRGHEACSLRAADAQSIHGLTHIKTHRARRAGCRREDTKRRTRMPALANMLLPHADADTRTDFIARHSGCQKLLAGDGRIFFKHSKNARQSDSAHMQNADAMHVIELKTLHQRTVDQDGMRRRQFFLCAPDGGISGLVHFT